MTKLSRTDKYKDLRDSLQNDTHEEIETRDLSDFQNRLNRIDSTNFSAPKQEYPTAAQNDPIHARRVEPVEEIEPVREDTFDMAIPTRQESYQNPDIDFGGSDYLDRYINEVKQYNIERGNAVSENTTVNILNRIHSAEQSQAQANRPFPQTERRRYPSQEQYGNIRTSRTSDTTEVPFINADVTPSGNPIQGQQTENMSTQQIADEVKNLVSGINEPSSHPVDTSDFMDDIPEAPVKTETSRMNTSEFTKRLELERTTRQQLLNETTQMRAQLDDYEDNLSEVSDKMRHTNKILNIVLIILIVALVFILCLVIYWIFLSKGGF